MSFDSCEVQTRTPSKPNSLPLIHCLQFFTMSSLLTYAHLPFKSPYPTNPRRTLTLTSAISSPEKRPRRKKKTKQPKEDSFVAVTAVSAGEKALRLTFMEELMESARSADTAGVSEVFYDMVAAGLSPGPRSFHGLIVSTVLNGDDEGAVRCSFYVLLL